MKNVKVGLIGCGNIAPAYIKGCRQFNILEVIACADLIEEKAKLIADEYGLTALPVENLLHHPEIEIIINLTIPSVHALVSSEILSAGKHVHSEKPISVTRIDGKNLLQTAEAKGLRVGCAPDTFMGGGLQTCRKLIEDGWIGRPVAATAFMTSRGPEAWHPNPFFFYEEGAGPLFDMGPYYLTALIHLLGPVKRVTGSAQISFKERIANSNEHYGTKIPVSVPTHVAGVIDFMNGAVVTIIMSFDVWASNLPRIEIYGSEGSISVPDPNTFGGPVKIKRAGAESWSDVPLTHSDTVRRGIGVADLAYSLQSCRPHRPNGEMAFHVLDIMHALFDASASNSHVIVESTCQQPTPLPLGLLPGNLDQ